MSGLLMGMAFYVDGTTAERMTLLALCDHATDDGDNVHPSVAKLAVKLQTGERAVQYNLARLERRGFIERLGKGGRGQSNTFHLNLDLLRAAYEKVHPSSPFSIKGAISQPERVQSPAERVQSDVEKGAISDPYLVSKKQPPVTTTVRESSDPPPAAIRFEIPNSVVKALDRCAVLGASLMLRKPGYWQAQVRAYGRVDLAAELLRAETWLAANPTRAPKKAVGRFLRNWLDRAHRDLLAGGDV